MTQKITYNRPVVLSVGGFDPSSGAGVLADIKTFEQHKVIGVSATTSITIQNENEFEKVYWLTEKQIEEQLEILFRVYEINVAKIALVENFNSLQFIISTLKRYNAAIKIIFDPILKATAGFSFHENFDRQKLMNDVYLITPNFEEAKKIFNTNEPIEFLSSTKLNSNILLKGGHSKDEKFAVDILFIPKNKTEFKTERLQNTEKHGSGCVLSSAIAANLAMNKNLEQSCELAKNYLQQFLKSNGNKLGFHT